MNSLSWLIYLADVLPSLGGILSFAAYPAIIATVIFTIGFFSTLGESEKEEHDFAARILKTAVTVALICGLFGALFPSKQTIMMIAASEFGEKIATTDKAKNLGGKSYQALDKFLSEYLEEKE